MTTARAMIGKRPLTVAAAGLHVAGALMIAGTVIFAPGLARAGDRPIAIEIAVDEELGDETPADQSWFGENGGEAAEDAEVEGEPEAGERPVVPQDGDAAPEPVPGTDGRDGG